MLNVVETSLSDDQAEDVIVIELAGKSPLADYMVIASGRSQRQVGAMADHLQRKLKSEGLKGIHTEGLPQCDWVLVDAGDIIIHLFKPEVREFYDLEKIWDQPDDSAEA